VRKSLTLELGAMMGVAVRLDQIEEMTRLLNQAQIVSVRREDAGGNPPAPR